MSDSNVIDVGKAPTNLHAMRDKALQVIELLDNINALAGDTPYALGIGTLTLAAQDRLNELKRQIEGMMK